LAFVRIGKSNSRELGTVNPQQGAFWVSGQGHKAAGSYGGVGRLGVTGNMALFDFVREAGQPHQDLPADSHVPEGAGLKYVGDCVKPSPSCSIP